MLALTAFALAAVASVHAQTSIPTTPANATALALSEAQYEAEGFDTPLNASLGFNIPLEAQALLGISYNGTFIENGVALTADQVANFPTVVVYPGANGTQFESGNYTLMLADASAIGHVDSEGDYRHYLANSVHAPEGWNASEIIFTPTNGTVITTYAGPGPLANDGVHRYAWMLFQQPESFTAPANLSTAGTAAGHWYVESYVKESGLGSLVAATFFTVVNAENDVATVTPSSVNPATIMVSTATDGAAASQTSGVAGEAKASGSSSSSTGAASSTYAVSSALLAVVAGVVAVVA